MAQFPPGFSPRFAPPPPWFLFRPPPPPPWFLFRQPPPPPWFLFRPPPPPASRWYQRSDGSNRVGIVAGLFICLVAMVCLYIAVCSLRRSQRDIRARAAAAAAGPETPSESSSVRVDEQPLHRACAASPTAGLPMFTYSQSVKHNVTGPGEEAATCSVCLGALQLGETVRLLPVCLHLYHAECIDPWLDAHSTCPICRSETELTTGVGKTPHVV